MNLAEIAYAKYTKMCQDYGHHPMTQEAYEKAISHISSTVNNTDAILRNNNRRKDKKDRK